MDADELELWAGRPETRNAIYERYRHEIDKLVEHAIFRMGLPINVDHDALVSAGHMGALQCIERFDVSKGLAFSTYAAWRIRGSILDELRHSDITRSVRAIVTQRMTAEQDLWRELDREPTQDEVCERLGWDPKQYLLSTAKAQSSIDRVLNYRNGGESRPRTLKDRVYVPEGRDLESTFREITQGLSIQEQSILYLYYWCGTSMKVTGQALGLSESRVSQIHSALITKLKTTAGERFADALRA